MDLCPKCLLLFVFISVRLDLADTQEDPDVPPEPWFGDFIGPLTDPQQIGIRGDVYVVNATCVQIINFTYGAQAPDLYFWLDFNPALTSRGLKVPTFEFGEAPLRSYENARVVLILPNDSKIKQFKMLGLWCQAFAKPFGHVELATHLQPPKAEFLQGAIEGNRYGIGSGPVLVLDRRTVKIYGFTFNGIRAPDAYFLVGQSPEPDHHVGVKVLIRGRDLHGDVSPIRGSYRGKEDLILELPETHDIYHIHWISVFSFDFKSSFGSIDVRNISKRIPPYVPQQTKKNSQLHGQESWPTSTLLGRPPKTNFTFQLGPPGGNRGYMSLIKSKPNEYVWYVNGYMTPDIWVKRGVRYTFLIEGGDDSSTEYFYNPLYISDEPFGGYSKLLESDREHVKIFLGIKDGEPINEANSSSFGRKCLWSQTDLETPADDYEDFQSFADSLSLQCTPGGPGLLNWIPDRDTPDTVYYQSMIHYNMGFKIMVADEIPENLPELPERPYRRETQLDNYVRLQTGEQGANIASLSDPSNSCLSLISLYCLARFALSLLD